MSDNVVIWRSVLLPPSETFIANQTAALVRYVPRFAGIQEAPGLTLMPQPASVLVGRSRWFGPLARQAFHRTGYHHGLNKLVAHARLVHAHFGPDGMQVVAAARRAKKPLVVTFHGYDATISADYRSDWPLTRRWQQFVQKGPVRVVAVSEFIRSQLIKMGMPPERVVKHSIGIPVPQDRRSRRSGGILFVGRLVEKKGCDILLEALTLLPPDLRHTPLTVIGDGPLRRELDLKARALRIKVDFVGNQTPRQVDEAMWNHRVFVGPSRVAKNGDTEGLGMVFLEAAARRMPVITSSAGGAPESVAEGATGFVVPTEDRQLLSRQIARILQDDELAQRFGHAGRLRVQRAFDIRTQTALLEDLYDDWSSINPNAELP